MKKTAKYRNVKTELDGIKFDSKRECKEYADLKLREKIGEITHLECHPRFDIVVNNVRIGYYKADFSFFDKLEKRRRVIDVKSPATAKTPVFRLKKRLIEAIYPFKIEIVQ